MTLQQQIKSLKFDYQYINPEVAKLTGTPEGDVEFFKLDKWVSVKDLDDEYDKRGLTGCPFALIDYIKKNPKELKEKVWIATQWDFEDGEVSYLAFGRWGDKRDVHCYRNDNEWDGDWWFAGVRKVSGKSGTLAPLDFGTLEKRIERIEKWIDLWETYDSGWNTYRNN